MDESLLKLIDGTSDAEATKLAARVRKELEEAADLGQLSAEAAAPVRAAAADLDTALAPGGEGDAAAAARAFLRRLVEVEVFNPLIARKLLDTGVRGGGP